MNMKSFKWFQVIGLMVLFFVLPVLSGCKEQTQQMTELEFTVVEEERLPEELLKMIENKKKEIFKLTYADGGYLYLCVGYGMQQTGGYSIVVNRLAAAQNAVYLDTDLMGPTEADPQNANPSYPYIVVKTPFVDKTVVFE